MHDPYQDPNPRLLQQSSCCRERKVAHLWTESQWSTLSETTQDCDLRCYGRHESSPATRENWSIDKGTKQQSTEGKEGRKKEGRSGGKSERRNTLTNKRRDWTKERRKKSTYDRNIFLRKSYIVIPLWLSKTQFFQQKYSASYCWSKRARLHTLYLRV